MILGGNFTQFFTHQAASAGFEAVVDLVFYCKMASCNSKAEFICNRIGK